MRTFLVFTLVSFVGTISFYLGRASVNYPSQSRGRHCQCLLRSETHMLLLILEVRLASKEFVYERLYGSRSSPAVDQAWLHLFPSYGGFFEHPTIAPERSTFSAFHQLHCVNSIRMGYWALYDAAISDQVLNETDIEMDASPAHMRHCIDMLRQAIMCSPDLTVEKKDHELGGVNGFGITHQCYDWKQLVHWVKGWDNEGVQEGVKIAHQTSHGYGHS